MFDDAHKNFDRQRKTIDDKFGIAAAQANDESALTDAMGNAAYRETLLDEQSQVIGAFGLAYVCSALKASLKSMARYFKNTNPPSAKEYSGKGWLAKIRNEYMDRFRIDFANSPVALERIEELSLARNAGVHWEGDGILEYLRKVSQPRFVDKMGNFAVTREMFLEAVADSEEFVEWIHSELKVLWKQNAGVNR